MRKKERGKRSEVRGQRPEARDQRPGDRGQGTEARDFSALPLGKGPGVMGK